MLMLENVHFSYEAETILKNATNRFADGRITAVTGPSGGGKTTLLYLLAGLKKPTKGTVVNDHKRTAVVFQEPRLFPWMTALENVKAICANDTQARAMLAELFDDDDVADKYPSELSGGMKQRIAIARALVYDPDLLLLDEPFRGLDEETKERTANVVWKHMANKTCILITHDGDDLAFCHEHVTLDGSPTYQLRAVKLGKSSIE